LTITTLVLIIKTETRGTCPACHYHIQKTRSILSEAIYPECDSFCSPFRGLLHLESSAAHKLSLPEDL